MLVALEEVVQVPDEGIVEFRPKRPLVYAPESPRSVLLTLNMDRVLFGAWQLRLGDLLCVLSRPPPVEQNSKTYPAHCILQRLVPRYPFASITNPRRVGRQTLATRRPNLSLSVVHLPSRKGLQITVQKLLLNRGPFALSQESVAILGYFLFYCSASCKFIFIQISRD